MSLLIERADFTEDALLRFLQQHLDDIAPTAPAESQHALDVTGLQQPGVRVWVARDATDRRLVGTVALSPLTPGHEELKSMRTDPALRGRGVATGLLEHALADALGRGVRRISLETGSMEFFAAARALYRRHGFVDCGPFGDYTDDPNSAYLTLSLG